MNTISIALNCYQAMRAYLRADKPEQWANANPDAWEMAADIRMLQRKRDKENGN
jgi:hypothetical protein